MHPRCPMCTHRHPVALYSRPHQEVRTNLLYNLHISFQHNFAYAHFDGSLELFKMLYFLPHTNSFVNVLFDICRYMHQRMLVRAASTTVIRLNFSICINHGPHLRVVALVVVVYVRNERIRASFESRGLITSSLIFRSFACSATSHRLNLGIYLHSIYSM